MTALTDVEFTGGTVITSAWLNGINDTVNALDDLTGSSLVGFTQVGTGAVASTVQAELRSTPQPDDYATFANYITATGPGKGLFTDWSIVPGETEAGRIRYVRDRLMVGDAANYDGIHWHDTIPGTIQGDGTMLGGVAGASWLTNRFKGAFQYLEHQGQSMALSARGYQALVVGAQSSDLTGNGAPIGLASIAINNKAGATQGAWCLYGVGIRDVNATTGVGATGMELHVSNLVNDSPQWDGYATSAPDGFTPCLILTQGGEHTHAAGPANLTDYDVSCAAAITRFKGTNGGAFLKGIVFAKTSLVGADGSSSTGVGIAMDMCRGHQIQWRSASGDVGLTSNIRCNANSKYVSPMVLMGNSIFAINQRKSDDTELNAFMVLLPALAAGEEVNGLFVNCTKTGDGNASLAAHGVDANIDVRIAAKGTGVLRYGTFTGNADAPVTGYITIRDIGGTLRKLAVIA